jgi:PmbA protein
MMKKIVDALHARKELAGWSLRHIVTRGAQVYLIGQKVEAQRLAEQDRYRIEVFRHNTAPDGSTGIGSGEITLLSNGDIESALDKASLVAGLVTNPLHTLPAPAPLPDVPLLDPSIQRDPLGVLDSVTQELFAVHSRLDEARMTSAEAFADVTRIHHVNSRGMDVEQEMSNINLEFVLQSRKNGREVETFREWGRRRTADLQIHEEVIRSADFTRDLLEAGAPPAWQGPVVLRGQVLADFVSGEKLVPGVLQTLGFAGMKYSRTSSWEIGKAVFRGEVSGDPLTVWANRTIPYGVASDRFDEEGLPAKRVDFIRENRLAAFSSSQRYADYLKQPATGAFGALEIQAGKWETSALLEEPHVEIAMFSWFNPNSVTGDFACEIRLGYMVENGVRKPFRGGQLIGNVLDALANVRWGKETALLGHYLGPTTARFGNLKVAGE